MSKTISSKSYKNLLKLLKEARLISGYTQAELAKKLKKPQSYVSKYEQGERRIDVIEFIDICKVLGVDSAAVLHSLK
jgi:transcriptional regulator with XRE-family HTH domain